MNRPKIVVEVNGGVVQAVYSDDPETTVALVDWDSEDSGPTEPNLVTATGADGREYLGFVGEIPADAWDAMPQETREAVQKGTDWMNRTNEPQPPDRNFLPSLSLVPPPSLHNRGCGGTIRHEAQHTTSSQNPKDPALLRSPGCV